MKYFDFNTAVLFALFGGLLVVSGIPTSNPNYWIISVFTSIIYIAGVNKGANA